MTLDVFYMYAIISGIVHTTKPRHDTFNYDTNSDLTQSERGSQK